MSKNGNNYITTLSESEAMEHQKAGLVGGDFRYASADQDFKQHEKDFKREAKVVEKNVAFQNLMTPSTENVSDETRNIDQSGEGK